jgi:predicted aldo/keto reductase-like oxidoreductase
MRPTTVALAALGTSAAIGLFVAGPLLYDSLVGLDSSAFPGGERLQSAVMTVMPEATKAVGGMISAFVLIFLLGVFAFFGMRQVLRARGAEEVGAGAAPASARRTFLASMATGAGAMVAGGGTMFGRTFLGWGSGGPGWQRPVGEVFGGDVVKTHPTLEAPWRGSRVQSYGRLGRTDWPVSDIVLGAGQIRGDKGTEVVKLALDRGVNYIDTAPDYSAAGSEEAVGRAIQDRPREELFLATKFCTPIGHLPAGTSVSEYKEVIYASLGRLGTDYVDLIHVHACDDVDRLMDPNMHQAFGELREEGKARFLGFSSHTPKLTEVADAAIDSGKFDVMMVAYHHGIWPELGRLISKARREQDMGVVAMKTLKGAKHHGLDGFQDDASSYAQSALKWVNSNPDVSCSIISFFELQHLDEYLYASGGRPEGTDMARLARYDQQIRGTYCGPHCGDCLDSCPNDVAIPDVLRHRMYFEDYRAERSGIEAYAKLSHDASACASCPAPCAGSCPVGIPIQERLVGAHRLLSVA